MFDSTKSSFFSLRGAILFCVVLCSLSEDPVHAEITVHGSNSNYEETGGDWLTMGSNDIDGSGGLGSDGFFFFGDFDGDNESNQPFSLHVKSEPSYVTAFEQGANWTSAADEFASYGPIDNPNDLNGSNDLAGVGLTTNGGAGTNNEVMTFTIEGLAPGGIVRVGVLAGTEGSTNGRWDPTSITLSEGTNSATVGNHDTNPLPLNPGGGNTGWVFFDLDANGTYAVSTTKRLDTQGSGVGGLTFDSVGAVLDITDPTDTDGDGIGDDWELFYFEDLSNDGTGDSDNDGLSDLLEWTNGTLPLTSDSDGDGISDGLEVVSGADPNSASSQPTFAAAPETYPYEPMSLRDSVMVFNEVHYHPAGDDSSLEFVEFYNQFAPDVDISNWRLDGEVTFDFPEGTILPGGGYLVVAKDPAALASATGFSGALGPFDGTLSNGGGDLKLYNNNRSFRSSSSGSGSVGEVLDDLEARRLMDEFEYEDAAPWPVGPDGSGTTLTKIDERTESANPYRWASSVTMNGSPGIENDLVLLKSAIAINEVSADSDANFRIELFNYGQSAVDLSGMIVRSSDPLHDDYVISTGSLASGAFLVIDANTLGFTPVDNDRLFLLGVGALSLVDAVRVDNRALARSPDGVGRFLRPSVATFGAANTFNIEDAIVINEIFYNAYPQYSPFLERDEEWLELHNRSGSAIDLSGWELSGGIRYSFPDNTVLSPGGYLVVARDSVALSAKHPGIAVIGDYSGQLGNSGDLIILEDDFGNPADEVQYRDSGQWHRETDGGGSSLELQNANSDNSLAEAWEPSDETARNIWQTYSYEQVAVDDSMGLNDFHELQIGLLNAGEFLIDDVSVIENGTTEMIQNRDFDSDSVGAEADKWRVVGTHGSHGKTMVANDPDDPSNQCLHVVATAPTENRHNKIETTFANGEEIVPGNTYRISFRAKWIKGSSLLNTKLYFNFVQRTHVLAAAEVWGTPGAVNTAAVSNFGPNLSELSHSPVVPDSGAPVTVRVKASDSNNVQSMVLRYSVNDASFSSANMVLDGQHYVGTIPGQSASATVRFYVEGRDSLGALRELPEAGASGGAFYKVQDGLADTSGSRHNLRIIMSESDRQFLFLNTNRMSNDRFPATVIENEETVYYDVALRLKASAHGRFNDYGFNLRFGPENLFRGVHESFSVERGGLTQQGLSKMLINRAGGGYWSFYDDVAFVIPPTVSDRGVAFLSLSRHTGSFFDGLFPDVDQGGTLFNHELHYAATTTVGNDPEGLKIGNPFTNNTGNYQLIDRGDDKELYRWGFQIRSARDRDDYSKIVELNQVVGELSGDELKEALDELIDVDQWMRTFAMIALNGTDDVYTRLFEHNFRFFVRPTDGKIITFQWDMDRAFRVGRTSTLIPTRNRDDVAYPIAKAFEIPEYRRIFDGHLNDLVETTFNSNYASVASDILADALGRGVNHTNYINNRANFASTQLPNTTSFAITTNSGIGFSTSSNVVTFSGNAWIDVFSIEVDGIEYPITWMDNGTWSVDVPVVTGSNTLSFAAFNNRGTVVGTDSITVTNSGSLELASATNLTISELHYNPVDPTLTEEAAGFTDADDFEFVELVNLDSVNDVNLGNVTFSNGVSFTFPVGTILAPDERILVVANQAAFETRYGVGATVIAGEYSGSFRNSGERVQVDAADGSVILDFTYGDSEPWPTAADGDGHSLVFARGDHNDPFAWRSSVAIGGNPGTSDSIPFTGGDLVDYVLASPLSVEFEGDFFIVSYQVNLAADQVVVNARFSTDLEQWTLATEADLVSRTNNGDGTATFSFRGPLPVSTPSKQFADLLLTTP